MLKNAARNLTPQQVSEIEQRLRTGSDGPLRRLIPEVDRNAPLPASFAQRRLWFLAQLEPENLAYNIPIGLRLRGALDEAALRRALDEILKRHEVLRTSFYASDGEPFQRIAPGGVHFALQTIPGDHADKNQLIAHQMAAEFSAPFDMEKGPLIRGRLVQLGVDDHALLLTVHHIVADGWSLHVFSRELSALYNAFSCGQESPLAPLAAQYADYAAWQRKCLSSEVLHKSADYWKQALSGIPPVLEIPADRQRSGEPNNEFGVIPFHLDTDVTHRLKLLSRRHGLTLFMTALAGWALVLSRLSGQEDVVIGVPTANRNRLEIEDSIGFFNNTLALRIDLSGNPTVLDLLSRVRRAALSAQAHQDLAFEQVVDCVNPVRSLHHTPVFQVMFAWQNHEGMAFDLAGLEAVWLNRAEQKSPFDLTLNLRERAGGIDGQLKYVGSLFDHATVGRYAGYFVQALSGMVEAPHHAISAISILSEDERQKLLVTWNRTEVDYPLDQCLHRLFEKQVGLSPSAIAVSSAEGKLTYAELNRRANQLAHYLMRAGVTLESRVGICMQRSLEMVVSLYAVLKAGGAYVPLDPDYPPERLAYMLKDCAPEIVLTHAPAREKLDTAIGGGEVRILDAGMDADLSGAPSENPDVAAIGVNPRNLAYIIYTSGSTGQPKGAMNEHRSVVNRLLWMQDAYKIGDTDTVMQKTPFSFDVSVWEFFWPLAFGARLAIAKPGGHKDIEYLASLIHEQQVTVLHFVPSMLGLFLEGEDAQKCESVRKVFCSGEALPASLVKRFEQVLGGAELHNLYGPTEAAIDVTAWDCRSLKSGNTHTPPIGRPIANTRIYILDKAGNPVPLGATGEIFIGGIAVGRGYWNRPDLTNERFVFSPFVTGDRLYRTGDLGRYLPDGNIEYLGRNDFQLKLRGFRIELGEIEARLLSHAGIREAVVMAREGGAGGTRLVAYYTVIDGSSDIQAKALRHHLAEMLPEYMLPAAFVRMSTLPLTSSGKIDRKALPAPDGEDWARSEYEAPSGETERTIARIWSEVIGVESIGRHDNFFDIGGHSLLAVRVITRVREMLGVNASLRALFEAPVLSGFSEKIEEVRALTSERRKSAEHRLSAMVAQMSDEEVDALIQGVGR